MSKDKAKVSSVVRVKDPLVRQHLEELAKAVNRLSQPEQADPSQVVHSGTGEVDGIQTNGTVVGSFAFTPPVTGKAVVTFSVNVFVGNINTTYWRLGLQLADLTSESHSRFFSVGVAGFGEVPNQYANMTASRQWVLDVEEGEDVSTGLELISLGMGSSGSRQATLNYTWTVTYHHASFVNT